MLRFLASTDESLARRCFSAASSYSRPRKDSIGLRSRSESANSLSRESLDGDATKRESPEKSGLKAGELKSLKYRVMIRFDAFFPTSAHLN